MLICGNKVDLLDSPSTQEIEKVLTPEKFGINYKLQLTSAKTGAGVLEGFKWLMQELLKIG